jgi:hypothetical protein
MIMTDNGVQNLVIFSASYSVDVDDDILGFGAV